MAKSFYGIIGYPLLQSFSPGYFQEKFLREGIDGRYQAYPLPAIEAFSAFISDHAELNGLNVTIPYKTAVIPFLDELGDDVKAIGAVNCIAVNNGKLTGYNTDWRGFHDSLKPLLQPHHRKALILGNGGAAKAVGYALAQLGIEFEVVSRGNSGGPFLNYEQVAPSLLQDHTLVINTTPLGMVPHEDRAPELPYKALSDRHLLYDLVYNPAETLFLRYGREQGAATKNGLEMLHLQAEGSWKIWQASGV